MRVRYVLCNYNQLKWGIKRMNEAIYLLVILVFVIVILSKFVVRLMKTDNEKYKIPILYGRILLGFLVAMLFYIIFLLLKGEDVISRLLG